MANKSLESIWQAAQAQLEAAMEHQDLQKLRQTLRSIQRSKVTVQEDILEKAKVHLAELSAENLRTMMTYRNYWALNDAAKDAEKDGVDAETLQEAHDLITELAQDVVNRLEEGIAKKDQNLLRIALEEAQVMRLETDVVRNAQECLFIICASEQIQEDQQEKEVDDLSPEVEVS